MVDKARSWTDKKLKKMEQGIAEIYAEAEKDMQDKWDAYMERGEKRIKKLQSGYLQALKDGDDKNIAEAKERLKTAELNFTLRNEQFQAMVDSVTLDMAQVNQMALDYIHGELPEIYAINYVQANEIVTSLGLNFTLPNKKAIIQMIEKGDVKTPFMRTNRFIKIPKDQRWNTKFINSQVLQGIIQGEDIRKISKRIFPEIMNKTTYEGLTPQGIKKRNQQAAVRNARTLVTGAENSGKWDSYKDLNNRGLVLKKVWIATGDKRTRDWHLMMDGQERELDEVFEDGNGDKLRYPADPQAEARTVYNCRCAMVTRVIGFRNADGTIRKIKDADEGADLHDKQITKEVARRKTWKSKSN